MPNKVQSMKANRRKRWQPEDDDYLTANYGLVSDLWIARRLGRKRTAIRRRAETLRLRRTDNFMTASDLARMFGVTVNVPIHWIALGLLRAVKNKHVYRASMGGGAWHIEEADLLAFMREHPDRYDLRLIDREAFPFLYNKARAFQRGRKPRMQRWTPERDALLLNLSGTLSLADLAVKLGTTYKAVSVRLTRLRAQKHIIPYKPGSHYAPKRGWTSEEVEWLWANYKLARAAEIAETLGRNVPGVIGKAKRLGIPGSREELDAA